MRGILGYRPQRRGFDSYGVREVREDICCAGRLLKLGGDMNCESCDTDYLMEMVQEFENGGRIWVCHECGSEIHEGP